MTGGTPAGQRTHDELIAYALLALAALCWSGNHVLGRAAAGHVPPFAISLFRWGVALVLLWPFAREPLRGDWPAIKANWRALVFLGVMGGAIFGVLQYVGARYTTAINISVLNSLAPVMIALAGAGLFGDKLSWRQGIGIAISLLGVGLIVTKADVSRVAALDFNWGDLIILFNVGVWAIYSVCLRWRPRMHWMSFTYCLAAISTVATLPFFITEHAAGARLQPTLLTVLVLGYVAVFPSVVGFAAWSRGVEILGPTRSGATMHLIPLFSALIASVALGEVLMAYHVAGFAMILAGVWLSSTR